MNILAGQTIANRIGGHALPAAHGATIDAIDPATGAIIGAVPRSDAVDVQRAVESTKAAQPAWAAMPLVERCAILRSIADGLEAHLDELAVMETQDTGKPITTSRTLDIPRAVRNFRFFADLAEGHTDPEHPMDGGHNRTHRKPVGIVGLITPWNLPLYLLSWKVAPALAMGNAIVAKPSELTPQTASALADIAQAAGLPDGILNIVHGLGPEAGHAIVSHPDIHAVSFTGGTATGRIVAKTAAPMFKKLSLELGGKNPTILFDDVDLDTAVAGAVRAGYTNTGQICLCGSRVLVQEGLAKKFIPAFKQAVLDLRIGDPMHPDTKIGPVVSHAHRDKVVSFLAHAREAAALTGGEIPQMPAPFNQGAFLRPAVITDVAQDDVCVQDEIFGPVTTVQTFKDEAEAIRLANGVRYGLAASVWSKDTARANRVAEALDTGMVWINDWLVRDLRVPFGGMKDSGVGREGGKWSLEFYSEARNVYARSTPST